MSEDNKSTNPLEEKLQKALRDLSILKNALIKEQALRKDVENKLREKEMEFKQKIEQVESLEFNNSRLTKRVESLMEDINKRSESKPSFMTNLWSGKHKDEIEKLQKDLSIMGEDLQVKIEENGRSLNLELTNINVKLEKLHICIYENKEEQRLIADGLENKIKTYNKLSEEQTSQIKDLSKKRDGLTKGLDEMNSKNTMLENELTDKIKLLVSQEAAFKKEEKKLSASLQDLNSLFKARVPFDEYSDVNLNGLNTPKPVKPSADYKQIIDNGVAIGEECIGKLEELSNSLVNKLSFISVYAEADDQKDYNEYSKKIRELLQTSIVKWKTFAQRLLKILSTIGQFDAKIFRKNIEMFDRYLSMKSVRDNQDITKDFGELLSSLENGEKFLLKFIKKHLFTEEITLVVDIAFIKEKNELILKEFKELREIIIRLFKDIEQLISYNDRETSSACENKALLWLSIAESLKKISKSIEVIALVYKDKLIKEEEGLSSKSHSDDNAHGFMNYTFQEKIPINKFKSINSDLLNILQSSAGQTQSALMIFAEYIEREFQDVTVKKGRVYPAHFINPNQHTNVILTQALNEHMKSQPKGIPYKESLDNRKSLHDLQEKEIFYNDQITSLKSALHQAENQLDYTNDDQSNYSDASTVKIYEKSEETHNELLQASKLVSFIKQKYEEVCRKLGEDPDYTSAEFGADIMEKWIRSSTSDEKKTQEKKSKKEEKADIFNNDDSEFLSENVAKGLQRYLVMSCHPLMANRLSMKFMNNQSKLIPLNIFTQADENDSERTRLLFEKAKEKLLEIALKNQKLESENEDYTTQYEAIKEALNAERELREKGDKSRKDLEKMVSKLKSDIESVTVNYDSKIQMLSEHIITLSAAKETR